MRESLVSRVVADIKENYDESYNYYVDHGCNEFADWLGVAHGSISEIIKELGWNDKEIRKFIVEERNDRRVTNWLTEDTADKWYFVGYFLGDGCLRNKGNSWNTNVSSKDLSPLDKFASRFGVHVTECKNSNGSWWEINIYSKDVFDTLTSLGMQMSKSIIGCHIVKPKVEFYGDYLRGLMDSDGYLRFEGTGHKRSWGVEWVGHHLYMQQIREMLEELGYNPKGTDTEGLSHVAIYRKEELEDLYYILYDNEGIKLDRKYDRYEKWMESQSNIQSIEETGEVIEMMDMEVEGIHRYYANNILVLNCAQELRMQANLANVKVWVDTFNSGGDLHKNMAIAMWGEAAYDKEKRKRAKVLNFGMLYGMSAYTLAEKFHVSLEEAKDIVKRYWKAVPEITAYQKAMLRKAKKEGTTYNFYGGPRRMKYYLNSDDPKKRSFAERTIENNPIQASCATLTKIALIKVYRRLYSAPEWKDDCHFFSYIHDEILSSVKKERVLDFIKIQKECMETKYSNMPVPFLTSVAIGNRWGNMFEWLYTEDGGLVPDMEKVEE